MTSFASLKVCGRAEPHTVLHIVKGLVLIQIVGTAQIWQPADCEAELFVNATSYQHMDTQANKLSAAHCILAHV